MATTILRPHDCLQLPNPNPKPNHHSRRRKRSSPNRPHKSPTHKGLVMGQVKILKRGEDLNPTIFSGVRLGLGLDLCSTDRLGPDPETVQSQIRVSDRYAAVSAPPPTSLPFPSSFVSRTRVESNLRKLLRI